MKHVIVPAAVAAAAVVLSAAAAAQPASRIPWFHLANRSMYCHVDQTQLPVPLVCWKPSSGYTMWMGPRGRVHTLTTRQSRKAYEDTSPVLRKGRKFTWATYRCTYNGTRLTCRNGRGHGWTIGPGKARRFF